MKSIRETHLELAQALRDRGEIVLQPKVGKPMGGVKGYIKTQIPHKDVGAIFEDKNGKFGLFNDFGALYVTGIEWCDLGLCDAQCWYEWMDPEPPEEEKSDKAYLDNATNRRFTVCVDFDGVIAEYNGWKGHKHLGDPMFGAKDALEMMKDRNWTIIVYTTRGNAEIAEYMVKYDLPYDWINHNPTIQGNNPGKPVADVYIDDHALKFTGWLNAWFALERMEPKGL